MAIAITGVFRPLKKRFIYAGLLLAVLAGGCRKKDPEPTPEVPEKVKLIMHLYGPKGRFYSVRFYLFDKPTMFYENPVYVSPAVIDSLDQDYVEPNPAHILVPYDDLTLDGFYYLSTEIKSGPSRDSLQFRYGGGGGPIKIPFDHADLPGNVKSLGSGPI